MCSNSSYLQVQQNFHLEFDEEQAADHFLGLIDYSYKHLGVKLTELVHRMAVIIKS